MNDLRLHAVRRLRSVFLLTALLLSVGLGVQSSLCPPGMDMGSEMEMGMGDGPAGEPAGPHCPFGASTDGDGGATCPFAVGGVGPCGTAAPVPAIAALTTPSAFVVEIPRVAGAPAPLELFQRVHSPPPRA